MIQYTAYHYQGDKPFFYTKSENGIVTEAARPYVRPFSRPEEDIINMAQNEVVEYFANGKNPIDSLETVYEREIDEREWLKVKAEFMKIQLKEKKIDNQFAKQAQKAPKPVDHSVDKLERRERLLKKRLSQKPESYQIVRLKRMIKADRSDR